VQDSSVSLQGFFENRLVEFRLRQQLLEPAILCFQLLEPLRFLSLHATVLVAPALEGWLADPQGLADLADRSAGRQHPIRIPQLADDLRGTMSRPLH
jgi:hypothetical protein